MAAEALFRRTHAPGEPLQYVVAQALMAAFAMGQQGRYPPKPAGQEPRRMDEPDPDPEFEAIFREMVQRAWSPLAGTPAPPGRVQWAMARRREAAAPPAPPPRPQFIRRAATPAPAPTLVVRRRR